MKILKPKFWDKKNSILAILLIPISLLYLIITILRKKISLPKKSCIPVVCVGNIYIGGTGKTPLSILIANLLNNSRKPAIIKKYYKNQIDEHELINQKTKCLILNVKRLTAVADAKNKGYDLAILDDGFQDYSIKKDLSILCFNGNQLIGNGMVLPSGPLRETLSQINEARLVVINGSKDEKFENKIKKISKNINIYYSRYLPTNIQQFKNKKLFAFAGIGNPDNFFKLLADNNLDVKKKFAFPDHYNYSKSEIEQLILEGKKNDLSLITTEKDYHRLKKYGFTNIAYLEIEVVISEQEKFKNQILKYIC